MPKRRMNPHDRNVIATIDSALGFFEIVRYDNGGKWFIERPHGSRVIISGDEAVSLARVFATIIAPGVHGTEAFYRNLKEPHGHVYRVRHRHQDL